MKIKFPKLDLSKIIENIINYYEKNKDGFLLGFLGVLFIDNIILRLKRKRDQKHFKQSTKKQTEIVLKHEAKINVLEHEAKQNKKAMERVNQLEQIVGNIVKEGKSNE